MILPLLLALLSGCAWVNQTLYPDGRGLEGQLEREVIALNQRVRALEHDLSVCAHGGDPGPIFPTLNQVFAGSEITVSREGAVTRVTLPVGHLFSDPYSLRFREESLPTLDMLSMVLNRYPNQPITVIGHTDDSMLPKQLVRRFGSHLDLSFQYAATLTQRLSEDFEVEPERFTVSGKGPWAPVATNDTRDGQAQNQRIEIQIFPPIYR